MWTEAVLFFFFRNQDRNKNFLEQVARSAYKLSPYSCYSNTNTNPRPKPRVCIQCRLSSLIAVLTILFMGGYQVNTRSSY